MATGNKEQTMIELKNNRLLFSFPEVHPEAKLEIDLQRTLRIPDDETEYPLPPGLGLFPLQHVDDHAHAVPQPWIEHGGVMLPMYQSEAMWLNFSSDYCDDRGTSYPFAVRIATGKIDAITGEAWSNTLGESPQNYVIVPEQPWLDGYCVSKGVIRQFVAMPLGAGYTAEEQITGQAETGGLQIMAFPMKGEVFEQRFPPRPQYESSMVCQEVLPSSVQCDSAAMGLAPGGKMRQVIYEDPYTFRDWDRDHTSRCFVHIANSLVWRAITGKQPPTTPATAKEYTRAGLPWFDYYEDHLDSVEGSAALAKLASVLDKGQEKRDVPLPENESVNPSNVVKLRSQLKKGQVREGAF